MLPLYSLLLFILYPLFLSFVSPCFLVSFTFFAIFSWSWIVSLTFFFCFLLFTKKHDFVCFLCWTCFTLFFLLCLVFLCREKWFLVFVLTFLFCFLFLSSFQHSVSHLLLSCFDVSEKMLFFSTELEKTSSVFSLPTIFLFFFFCSFFFFKKKIVTNPFIFELFLEFLVNPFTLFTFIILKKSAQKPSFFVSVQSLFCVTFFLSTFSLFSIITFSLIIFSFHPFVHPFLLFSPFSLLSFLHSFFISLSHVSLTFFLHRRCCVSSFYFNSFFFSPSLSLLILISLFSYFFSRFLLHLRLCFFQKKIQNFLWSMFRRRNYVFIFWTLPLSVLNLVCFSSLRRHFSLFVLCFLFFRFFIVTFLDHRYFSWFSFFNLLLGLFKKNGLFSRKKSSKISFFCLFSFWKKSLLFFFLEIKFCYTFVFSCMISKTLCHFLCFQSLPFLGGKFLVSLCFCPLQKNLWKVMDALYFFSLLILDSFSLYVSSRYDYSPCCCSACWQKNWSKKTCVLLFFFAQSSKKKTDKNSFFFSEVSSFSLFFYSLPFKKSIFANKHMFYQFYRFVSLSL